MGQPAVPRASSLETVGRSPCKSGFSCELSNRGRWARCSGWLFGGWREELAAEAAPTKRKACDLRLCRRPRARGGQLRVQPMPTGHLVVSIDLTAAVRGGTSGLRVARPGHPWPGDHQGAPQARFLDHISRPSMANHPGFGSSGPAIHGRAITKARGSARFLDQTSRPSMAKHPGFGSSGPAIHGRAFAKARGSAAQSPWLTPPIRRAGRRTRPHVPLPAPGFPRGCAWSWCRGRRRS